MEENELTSIAYSDRKRKVRDEHLKRPSPKQICRVHHSNHGKLVSRGESDPESASSNSFHSSSSYSFVGFSSQNRLSFDAGTRGQESSSINEDQDLCAEIGFYTNEDLVNLLYSNGLGPFVLSTGIWDINQGAEEGKKKLTIDKEFEQHFSMLMM